MGRSTGGGTQLVTLEDGKESEKLGFPFPSSSRKRGWISLSTGRSRDDRQSRGSSSTKTVIVMMSDNEEQPVRGGKVEKEREGKEKSNHTVTLQPPVVRRRRRERRRENAVGFPSLPVYYYFLFNFLYSAPRGPVIQLLHGLPDPASCDRLVQHHFLDDLTPEGAGSRPAPTLPLQLPAILWNRRPDCVVR